MATPTDRALYAEGDRVAAIGSMPIHAAGVVVPAIDSVPEALRLGGLDWRVGTRPVGVYDEDTGTWSAEADYQATYRMDTGDTLGIVGRLYKPMQNEDAFAPIQPLVDEGRLAIEAVGALRGGRIPFIVAALPGASFEIAGEPHDTRLLLLTSHDGSRMLQGVTWPTRLYCLNALRVMLGGRGPLATGKIRFRHTSGGLASSGDRARVLAVAMEYSARFAQYAERLSTQVMGDRAFDTFLTRLMPNPKGEDEAVAKQVEERRDAVRVLWQASPNLENIRGTHWAAYNAVAEYVDYHQASRETRRGDQASNKAMSVIHGQGHHLKQAAWDLLLARKPAGTAKN